MRAPMLAKATSTGASSASEIATTLPANGITGSAVTPAGPYVTTIGDVLP